MGIEPTIFNTLGGHVKYYITKAVLSERSCKFNSSAKYNNKHMQRTLGADIKANNV
jgi:hypothetical protein